MSLYFTKLSRPGSTREPLLYLMEANLRERPTTWSQSAFLPEETQWTRAENGTHAVYASDLTTVDKLNLVFPAIFRNDIPVSCIALSFFTSTSTRGLPGTAPAFLARCNPTL